MTPNRLALLRMVLDDMEGTVRAQLGFQKFSSFLPYLFFSIFFSCEQMSSERECEGETSRSILDKKFVGEMVLTPKIKLVKFI